MLNSLAPQPFNLVFAHLSQWEAVMHSTLDKRTARQHAAHAKRYLWQAGIQHVSEITSESLTPPSPRLIISQELIDLPFHPVEPLN